jgi:hypothetical protein
MMLFAAVDWTVVQYASRGARMARHKPKHLQDCLRRTLRTNRPRSRARPSQMFNKTPAWFARDVAAGSGTPLRHHKYAIANAKSFLRPDAGSSLYAT